MSTRSRIGMQNVDGSISSIYCHYDGYITGVGAACLIRWCSRESVSALLSLGDISSLGDDMLSTVAYHRDRGESLEKPRLDRTPHEYLLNAAASGIEFCYYIDVNGDWLWAECAAASEENQFSSLYAKFMMLRPGSAVNS